MTESLMLRDKAVARKKGLFALSAWAGTVIMLYYSTFLGFLAAAGAAYLTYRWFMFRAKRGMRF
jgi:hypothetical protein